VEQDERFVLCECHFVLHNSLIHHSVPDNYADDEEFNRYVPYEDNNVIDDDDDDDKKEDTDIDEDKMGDLEKDAAANMPPKKKRVSPKPSASKKKAAGAAVNDDIAGCMTRMSVAVVTTPRSVSLDFKFPFAMHRSMDEETVRIYIELVGCQLPDDYLKHAKVLPSRMKFSVLIGAPHMMFE
jgi:hypothetical protein